MGIIFSNAALMAQAKQGGVCFDQVLTIGHLTLYVSPAQIRQLNTRYGRFVDPLAFANEPYADEFLKSLLDAKSVKSLDYSDYEKCDSVHDMNRPVDAAHHEQFDVVIDGGSLEHIFNFPTAIANCMNMVKPGGSLFMFTMANNHMGHGFYQFSPELLFRIFQSENGFEIRSVILEMHHYPGAELSHRTKCYSVTDPAVLKMRVGLVSKSPVMMMIHAMKTETKPLFTQPPIQSDYSSIYAGDPAHVSQRQPSSHPLRRVARTCLNLLPVRIKNFINGHRQLWHYSFSNRRFYRRWYPV